MGRNAKLKAQRRQRLAAPTPDQVWAKCNSPYDGPAAAFLARLNSNQATMTAFLQAWRQSIKAIGTDQLVGLFESNKPGTIADAHSYMPIDAFEVMADELGVDQNAIASARRILRQGTVTIPPTCVVWFDGQPNGDFVSQMLLLEVEQ